MSKIIEYTPPVSLRNCFAIKKNNGIRPFHNVTLTFRGRDAISLAVEHFELKKSDVVLFPGFLCKIIVNPFTDNLTPEYYDIEKDLSINTEYIESILSNHKVKVLYIIHYFGFLHENLSQLSRICKKHGVLLWEDHAHSALSQFSYNFADAMIFSFRKVLPIPDGGGLWLPNTSPMKISRGNIFSSNITSMLIVAHRSKWGINKNIGRITHSISCNNNGSQHNGHKKITPKPISYFSKRIIKSIDMKSIFTIRRDIFLKWQDLLVNSQFNPVFTSLPEDACPQSFPILVQNPQELLIKFWKFNVCLKNRWPLEEQMKEKCPTAFNLSNSIFALPIYPGLSQSDMELIMTLLKQYGKPLP